MTSIAYLDINVWVDGWLSQPNLIIIYKPAPSTDKTVKYKLADMNGTVVTDEASTTLSAGSEKISINLGDFIDAQKDLYGFGAGLYFVVAEISEDNAVFVLPLFISEIGVSDPPTGREDLDHLFIIDKITGYMMKLPASLTPVPVDDRYMVFAYYHKQGKGRIVQFDATGTIFDTGYHRYVKLRLSLSFNSFEDMLYHMLMRSWNIPEAVMETIVDEINNGNYDTVLKLLRPYYSFTWIGRTLMIEFDTSNYEIKVTTFTYLGQWDWGRILGYGAAGCGIAVGVALAYTIVTAGTGAITLPLIAGACLSGGFTGLGIGIITSSSNPGTTFVIRELRGTGDRGKQLNQNYYDEAKTVLDDWKAQDKITQEDYDKMIQILNNWKAEMDATIDELVALGENAYQTGKKEGMEESKWWIVGAGVGGLALGILVGRR